MRKKKIGKYDQQAMLQEKGIELPASMCKNGQSRINPICRNLRPRKENLLKMFQVYDLNQCCSRYVWKNLPNGIKSWRIEQMLYYRGCIAGFYLGGKIYILPFTTDGNINGNGAPTKVTPIPFNGGPLGGTNKVFAKKFDLNVDIFSDENDKYSAVLLYDSIPYYGGQMAPSRYAINQQILDCMANLLSRVDLNIEVSSKKIIFKVRDIKQIDVVRTEIMSMFENDLPFDVVAQEYETQDIINPNDLQVDQLFNAIKNYDEIRLYTNGIHSANFGTEKKERLVTGELNGNAEQSDLVLDMGLDLRQEFCDLMNAKFGTNITVQKRNEVYADETEDFEEQGKEGEDNGINE